MASATPADRAREEQEKQRGRDRLRYVSPKTCGKITAHDRYWTLQFLVRYLFRCETLSLERPRDGYLLARPLPDLVDRIPVRPDDVRHFDSEKEKRAHEVLAHAVLGSACSLAGEPEEADLAFRRAADRLPAPAWAGAELKLRYGSHLARMGDASAERYLADSLDLWARAGDEIGRARTHLARGTLLGLPVADCVVELARAIILPDRRTKVGRRTCNRAIQALARKDLVLAPGLAKQEEAFFLIKTAQDAFKGRSTDPRKARLVWIEGVLLGNLAVSRHAERLSRAARSHFRELKALVDFVLVSLDLARFLVAEGSIQAARELRAATLEDLAPLEDAFEDLGSDAGSRVIELVASWPEAKDSSDLTLLRRRIVAEETGRGPT